MYNNILTEVDENGILLITINRESKLNALNMELLKEIDQALQAEKENAKVKGAIITGKGEKAFAAGADIAEFAGFNLEEATKLSSDGHGIFNRIESYPKPVIAAVNGFALGGGCELTMACHMRIASDNAKFGQPEVNLGVIPGYGGTQRLPQLIGKGRAMEFLMTGDMIDAEEAYRIGLANRITSLEDLLPTAKKIISKIARKGPLAIAKVIDCTNAAWDPKRDGFQLEIDGFAESFETEDFKEGTTAFLEKRRAEFKGA